MLDYNERLLKNALDDIREENDELLSKEIEDAKNDTRFQNKDGEAENFARKYAGKSKKNPFKKFLKVASVILVVAISVSFIPLTVEGRKSSVAKIVIEYMNSEYMILDFGDNENSLRSYKGEYVPTWVPEGYKVNAINSGTINAIDYINSDNKVLLYSEHPRDSQTLFSYEEGVEIHHLEILGFDAITYTESNSKSVIIATDTVIIDIVCTDMSADIIGFAKCLEKR